MDIQIRLRKYKKEYGHSYSFGVFPTLELLQHHPEKAWGVLVHPRGAKNTGIDKIRSLCTKHQIPFEFQERVFQRIGARQNDYAIGIFEKSESTLDNKANHVVLVNPTGMGNLGTIQRTMLGFDFQDLAIIQPAADIYHPEAVRASMGAMFQLRLEHFLNFNEYRKKYPRNYYLFMTDGRVAILKLTFKPPFSLVFGNESAGLPQKFHSFGTSVRIDQSDKIDSLNIAISIGISLFEARNQEIL